MKFKDMQVQREGNRKDESTGSENPRSWRINGKGRRLRLGQEEEGWLETQCR